MERVRTVEPINITDLKLLPGKTRGAIVSEIASGKSKGTRRAVKVKVWQANRWWEGWVSRRSFELAQLQEMQARPGYHREFGK